MTLIKKNQKDNGGHQKFWVGLIGGHHYQR